MATYHPAPSANFFSTTLNGAINDSVTTITLNSVTNLSTSGGVLIIDREDGNGTATPDSREFISFTGISGSDLTGVTRSFDNSTARSHSDGALVEATMTVGMWNDLRDGVAAEHNTDGTHSDITAATASLTGHFDMADTKAIRDGNNNEWLIFSETGSAVNELTLSNAAAGNAPDIATTGGDTDIDLGITLKGTGVIAVTAGSGNYEDNVTADDDVPNKKYVDDNATPSDGWVSSSDTWVYATATTFTISGVDRTTTYTAGTKLKFTNSSAKFAYVGSSSFSTNTTVTLVANNDYALADAAISVPFYSHAAVADNFPYWFGYDPTWTGFSSDPTQDVHFRIEGGMCTLLLESSGTSDAAGFDFTLPISSSAVPTGSLNQVIFVLDNGPAQTVVGLLGISVAGSASSTAKVGLDFTDRAANAYGGFTTSNAKGIEGVAHYPILI